MMTFRYALAFLVVLVFGVTACNDDDGDDIIRCGVGMIVEMEFGHFYGYCAGEGCVEIFKIGFDSLYEDVNDFYPSFDTLYNGNYQVLDQIKFEKVKDIINAFPYQLLSESNHVIGDPDGGDWGGIYVSIWRLGYPKEFWYLDQNDDNMPEIYNDFVDLINYKIAVINQ